MSGMKILQIHSFMKSESLAPAAGGMARAALQLTKLLAAAGHEVRVLPIPEGMGSRVLWELAPGRTIEVSPAMDFPAGADLRWLPFALSRIKPKSRGLRALYYDACALTALRRAVGSFRPDIIHNHLAREPFPRLAQGLGLTKPLILTHHHYELGERLMAYDRIIFPSGSSMDQMIHEGGYPREKARKVSCPVQPVFTRERRFTRKKRVGIFFVGMIRLRKGIDLLLDAYRQDKRLWAEPLHICGYGPDHALIEEAVSQDGLPIIDEGMCTPEQLVEKLDGARLVVIPSRMESLCIALLEALCCGVPVVGWGPTVREVEQTLSLKAGIPFDGRTQSARELADSIHLALASGFSRSENRQALAEAARQAFSEDSFLKGNLEVYRELV